jgi:Flp pilus assembly protein TadD
MAQCRTQGTNAPPAAKEALASLAQKGMIYRETNRFEEAREVFSSIRSLHPSHPIGEIGLGSICFAEGHFAEACGHYRQALKLDPRSAYAYALLGESQVFLGEYGSARVSLGRAAQMDPRGAYGQLAQNLLRFVESVATLESVA